MNVLASTLKILPALFISANKLDSLYKLWIHIPIHKDITFYLLTKMI